RKHHTIKAKRDAKREVEGLSQREAVRQQGFPRWTLNDWRKGKEGIRSYTGSEKKLSRGQGRRKIVPFGNELVTFMKDICSDCEVLTATVMACFVHDQHPEWLDD
ncbi:hypothetical protein JG687_00017436, partial [Phytophthora cactorum]